MNIDTVTPGVRIRVAREARLLTQRELAVRVGVSQSAVAGWEAGRTLPALRHREALTAALFVPIEDLFNIDNKKEMDG